MNATMEYHFFRISAVDPAQAQDDLNRLCAQACRGAGKGGRGRAAPNAPRVAASMCSG
jgi:hypothetical protein